MAVADGGGIPESRIALKASLGAFEEKSAQQDATIKALRAEVAGLQEQLTLQTAGHVAEVGRLGAGTLPVSEPKSDAKPRVRPGSSPPPLPSAAAEPAEFPASRERRVIPRLTLAERVAQARLDTPEDDAAAAPLESGEAPAAKSYGDDEASSAGTASTLEPVAESPASPDDQATERRPSRIKSRLLDRISDLSKAKA